MTKYRMYIDETGNTDLNHTDDPNHRFLSLTGVIVDLGHIRETVHPEMEALKVRYFDSHPDEPVIFHRKEMVNRKRPFANLRDMRVEYAFNQDLLKCLREWEYRVVTVCLDKKNHVETYGAWVRDPYHYCMAILLERFNFWLNRRRSKGDVMAESRGGGDDRRLKKAFLDIWESGTNYVAREQFQRTLTSKNLKIKPKAANISGLQLADLIANPSRCEILDENGLLGRALGTFTQAIIEALKTKYDRDAARTHGKKFL